VGYAGTMCVRMFVCKSGCVLCCCSVVVLRLNDVATTRSSAAFNDGDVELVSALVGGDVTPWCERARGCSGDSDKVAGFG